MLLHNPNFTAEFSSYGLGLHLYLFFYWYILFQKTQFSDFFRCKIFGTPLLNMKEPVLPSCAWFAIECNFSKSVTKLTTLKSIASRFSEAAWPDILCQSIILFQSFYTGHKYKFVFRNANRHSSDLFVIYLSLKVIFHHILPFQFSVGAKRWKQHGAFPPLSWPWT